jgi:hypothetical protein
MNKRIAKKTAKNYERGSDTPWGKVLAAFRRLGRNAPEAREKVEEVVEKVEDAVEEVREAVVAIEEAADLTKMRVAELKGLAKSSGIQGISKMRKADLISAIEAHRKENA